MLTIAYLLISSWPVLGQPIGPRVTPNFQDKSQTFTRKKIERKINDMEKRITMGKKE